MSARQRLDSIIGERLLRGFPPYGASTRCVCLSECSDDHLKHLVSLRGFSPWGIVITRSQMMKTGGGSIAYVPPEVYAKFKTFGLEHWAMRTEPGSTWMHEREWRLPLPGVGVRLASLAAILIGDPAWRPSLVPTDDWIDPENGLPCEGPGETPFAQQVRALPALWQESPIWVWNATTKNIDRYKPGELG
ncbi:hypothetical protein AB0O51_13725 [Streptomyces sp. NPDC090301]|uniref:hypothetical protein n=1 Tax=Streptomyces sp. NPDC090301 TaxID=3154975 RepID=UPI0034231333